MALITPNIDNPTASLSSPLITPGGIALVTVPMSSAIASVVLAKEGQDADLGSPVSPTRDKVRASSGHSGDRVI
jgi:hypothetical protein